MAGRVFSVNLGLKTVTAPEFEASEGDELVIEKDAAVPVLFSPRHREGSPKQSGLTRVHVDVSHARDLAAPGEA